MNSVYSLDVKYNVLKEYLQEKQNICLYPETVQRKRSKFRRNSHGCKLVEKLEM